MDSTLSRKIFLKKTALAGAAALLSSLEGFAMKAENNKIKVAIIGCGSVSRMYLPHLTKSPFVEVVSVCDIITERASERAKKFNVPNHFPHIDQLLAGPSFDLLINLTNMQEHGRLNWIGLQAGKNIWSEKPMANSYAEGKSLYSFAKSKNLKIWGAPAVVNSPQFAYMAKAIQEGKLGKVAAAHAHYGHTGPTWSAFFYEKLGGSLPDLGVYNIASLTGLLGPAKSVVAMTSIVTKERKVDNKGKIKVEAEDNAMLIMDHGNGVLSHVHCGFNYFDPNGHTGVGSADHTIKIWGTHGNMALAGYDWAPFGVDVTTLENNEKTIRYAEDAKGYVWEEGASVISESMVKGVDPKINVEHALHVLEIIEATRKAGLTGRRINLVSKFKWPMF